MGNRSASLDGSGNVVILGGIRITDYPVTAGVFQATNKGGVDGVLSELSPNLSTLLASTYRRRSGNDMSDHSAKIGSDANGDIFSTLDTNSTDFPRTNDAYQKTHVGNAYDMVVFGSHPTLRR